MSNFFALASLLIKRDSMNYLSMLSFGLLLPGFICYAGFVLGSSDESIRANWIMGSLVVAFGTTTFSQVAFSILNDRNAGMDKILNLCGVSTRGYILYYVLYGLVLTSCIALSGIGILYFTNILTHFTLETVVLIVCFVLSTSLMLTAVGIGIGFSTENNLTGDVLVNLIGILLVLLSPIFYNASDLPGMTKHLANLSPYTHVSNQFKSIIGEQSFHRTSFYGYFLFTLTFSAFTLYRLRKVQNP